MLELMYSMLNAYAGNMFLEAELDLCKYDWDYLFHESFDLCTINQLIEWG